MKYKNVPFNMTLAKHIGKGSVYGRVRLVDSAGAAFGYAKYVDYDSKIDKYLFQVSAAADNTVFGTEEFDINGKYCFPDGQVYSLIIEIPVEDSYDDDAIINSLADSFVVQEKDPHYHKCKIEPIDYILANNLDFCEGNIVKYITRYKDKGGKDDLRKIKVYVDYLIDKLTKESNDTTSD